MLHPERVLFVLASLSLACASGRGGAEDSLAQRDRRAGDRRGTLGNADEDLATLPDLSAQRDQAPDGKKPAADTKPWPKPDTKPPDAKKPADTKPWPVDSKPTPDTKPPDAKKLDGSQPEICDDGVDNDGDKLPDCADLGSCGGKAPCVSTARTLVIHEVQPGSPDYVVLRNASTVTINVSGHTLVMYGIDTVTFVLPTKSVLAGGTVAVFEYSSGGANDISTSDNIPFYDGFSSNAVVLKAPGGTVIDYVGFGDSLQIVPPGMSQTGGPVPYSGFVVSTDAHHRAGMKGVPPTLQKSDWVIGKKSR
jgi:hypothetical protein